MLNSSLRTLPVVLLGSLLSAQSPTATAGWAFHGDDCAIPVASLNDNHGTLRTGTLTNEYAFGWKAPQATTLVGFQLYTRTNSLPVASMTCTFYRESTVTPGTPDATAAQTATMTCFNTVDFYGVWFTPPFQVAANETIWFGQTDSNAILAAGLSTGASPAISTYWRRPPTTLTWAVTGTILYPAWRLISSSDLACTSVTPPKIGTPTSLDLQGGPASAPAALFLGVSNPAFPLPFCVFTKLLSSAEVTLSLTTTAAGKVNVPLAVPNDPALDGGIVWTQFWAIGPGSTLLGTNGAQATLGN